jgi:murein L,D-transpeptidase YcbB/YkuD
MKTYNYLILLLLLVDPLQAQDKKLSDQIFAQLTVSGKTQGLGYPASVKRFYGANNFQPVWVKPQSGMGTTWQAMLMLDCVLQFGLAHADYHPYELSVDSLHTMLEKPSKLSWYDKARFEIVLTDAMITFMNHLHYGKFNPRYLPERIDQGRNITFLAVEKLKEALLEKDFMQTIIDVQPKNTAFRELQEYMHLAKGQYTDDCYEFPEADIRLAAINMERLRWLDVDQVPFLHINIPSFELKLVEPDSTYVFKVIVGKLKQSTPSGQSAIGYFTTGLDWKVPQNIGSFLVYLHNSPNHQLFDKKASVPGHGYIRVQKASTLAALLMRYDRLANRTVRGQKEVSNYRKNNVVLRKPIPITVTYLTCTVKDGQLERYQDIYELDQLLVNKLYNIQQTLTLN